MISKDKQMGLKRFYSSQLFRDVQVSDLFEDSKTFVDAVPKSDIDEILEHYTTVSKQPDFDLKLFVEQWFELQEIEELICSERSSDILTQIHSLWDVLRKPADKLSNSSLIELPNPYTVPGGRFQEIYYWDSYFAGLGLVASDRVKDLVHLVNNFVAVQERVGHIPNGNRWYYDSRSQPPVLAMLIELLNQSSDVKSSIQGDYLNAIEKEYRFWMEGAENIGLNQSHRRVVRLKDGEVLNRFYDDEPSPRPESFKEDIELAAQINNAADRQQFYLNIRAACESGWDFSSRWLRDTSCLESIATTELIPIDLNCLLYFTESYLAKSFHAIDPKKSQFYANAADVRKKAINKYLWSEKHQHYVDYWFNEGSLSDVCSLAGNWALFFNIASTQRAAAIKKTLEADYLKAGGLVTTNISTGQQWDSPNGWAPLQWIAIIGLENYEFNELAEQISERWVKTVKGYFDSTGKLMEKYNVLNPTAIADGGEYDVQEGFGWTNGVTQAILKRRERG